MRCIWLPGWQFSEQVFEPLLNQLSISDAQFLNYRETQLTREQWLESTVEALPEQCELIGWSLGGMLACELALLTSKVKKVLVLNANVKFSGGPGLDPAIASSFMNRYKRNAQVTQSRFASLVDTVRAKDLKPYLLSGDHLAQLEWLYSIDLQNQKFSCPVHILLAENDQLVPVKSARSAWSELATTVSCIDGEHSSPFVDAAATACWIEQYG